VVISLAVVLGLFWLVARTGARKIGVRDRGLVRVRSRQALTRGSSLAVVEVGARVLVVGVSDSGVRLLTELDPLELESTVPSTADADVVPDHVTVAAVPVQVPVQVPTTRRAGHRGSHRAARPSGRRAARLAARTDRGEARTTDRPVAPDATALGGSVLAPATWRQAWAAATGRAAETAPGVSGDAA
jgi:flagellar protein FliO/FliZ